MTILLLLYSVLHILFTTKINANPHYGAYYRLFLEWYTKVYSKFQREECYEYPQLKTKF